MRSVLFGVERAMAGEWELEYLTQHVGPSDGKRVIHRFGTARAHPWNVPEVWEYTRAGHAALRRLLQSARYDLLLPQDGVYTSFFTMKSAAAAAIPVMAMDHGNVTLPASKTFREERLNTDRPLFSRPLAAARFALYRRTLIRMTAEVARGADAFLAAGDDVADAWVEEFGVPRARITPFPFSVDAKEYEPLREGERLVERASLGVPPDGLLLAMVNRLVPEKAPELALRTIAQAASLLADDERRRLRVVIAGEGPLRTQLERDIVQLGLTSVCSLTGALSARRVSLLLRSSDAFLYTATRGINSLAVLEAMAAGCAVVATAVPELIANYLADGRGIAVSPGDAEGLSRGLARVLADVEAARSMGRRARAYVAQHHSDAALRSSLRQAAASATAASSGSP